MTRGKRFNRRLGVGLVAGVLTMGLAPGLAGPSAAAPDGEPTYGAVTEQAPQQSAAAERAAKGIGRARVPNVRWRPCRGPLASARASCATVRVPLDYDRPRGATTALALLKYRAARPRTRIGSLFVNPGGPGGESRGFATAAGRLLGASVDRRFDIIGIDPRGVGGSGASVCRGRTAVSPFTNFGYPITGAQVQRKIRADRSLRRLCKTGATRIVDHASTADDARDMELVRRALGDRRINYYGVSYGSYLGQTYAAMFPRNIRALTVDAILDPIAWSTGDGTGTLRPFTYRLRSGKGAFRALTSAFAECDRVGPTRCRLARSSATKWRQLLAAARDGELAEVGIRREQDLIGFALSVLYDAGSIKPFFGFLADLHATLGAPEARRAPDGLAEKVERWRELSEEREERGPFGVTAAPAPRQERARPTAVNVAFEAVACSDTRNPRAPFAWERAARLNRMAAWFGRLWTWGSSACAERGIGNGSDSFRGPWKTRTSTPLLIVGNEYDPATPISGARRANKLFTGSSLLHYDGYGHGNLGENRCVTKAYQRYFVSQRLPRNGSSCSPDRRLFP